MHMCDLMDQSTLYVHNSIYWVDSAYISWHGGEHNNFVFFPKMEHFFSNGRFCFSFLIICMVYKPNHQLLCPYSHIHCIIAKRNQIQNGTSIMQNGKQTCPTMQYNSSHNAIFKMKSMEDRCYLSLTLFYSNSPTPLYIFCFWPLTKQKKSLSLFISCEPRTYLTNSNINRSILINYIDMMHCNNHVLCSK